MAQIDKFDFSFEQIVKQANDAIIITDSQIDLPGPRIIYVNDAFTKLTGYSPEDVIGKTPRILQGPDTSETTKKAIREALTRKKAIRVDIKNYSSQGEEYWHDLSIIPLHNAEGKVTHFAAIQREITEQKRRVEELNNLSNVDSLTTALNRRAFDSLLSKYYNMKSLESCHLMMIDIDDFKVINDSFGHLAGDEFLKKFVRTLREVLRGNTDMIARIGGEEFGVFLIDIDDYTIEKIAQRILHAVKEINIDWDGRTVNTTVSIGISQILDTDENQDKVCARADMELYKAKSTGKNKYKIS